MSAQYTCITCRVAFQDADIQRQHYKTDWHRYNLKRKVAELPPVTSDDFQQRVLQQRKKDESALLSTSVYCNACRKNFSTQNAHDNHLNSKKHKDNLLIFDPENTSPVVSISSTEKLPEEDDSDVEEVDSDEWNEDKENPIDDNNCLFCTHHSRTMVRNLRHMTLAHSFFIPDAEYCTDIHGLLTYLGEKIFQGFMCLWCNEKGRTMHSAEAAQKHMRDKGHCKMLHEGVALAEYADYYDYSTSYPDQEDQMETDSEISVPVIDDSDYQLVLPSGITVGHRSLMRYYNQSLDPNRRVAPPNKKLHKVLAQYRSLGWTATQQEAAARKARDLHYMRRIQSKWITKLGVKANKMQHHFRVQVTF